MFATSLALGTPFTQSVLTGAHLGIAVVLLFLVSNLRATIFEGNILGFGPRRQHQALLAVAWFRGQSNSGRAKVGQLSEVHEVFEALDAVFCKG